jgi:hypothetical protein
MITIQYNGRLCNNIIQYLAASIFGEKFNLKINDRNNFEPLIKTIYGENEFDSEPIIVNETNFMDLLNSNEIENKKYHFDGYFQMKEFFNQYEKEIKKRFLEVEMKHNDKFSIHYRLGDVESIFGDCPYEYFEKAINILEKRGLKKGYLITDSPNHPKINRILNNFLQVELYHSSPMEDLIFGMAFDNLILSKGTYSFILGYNSKATSIYYEDVIWNWTPKIFLEEKWIKIEF